MPEMPGLAQREALDKAAVAQNALPVAEQRTPVPPAAPTIESLTSDLGGRDAIIETLRGDIRELNEDVDHWQAKFRACDNRNGELQTEVAQLRGQIPAKG